MSNWTKTLPYGAKLVLWRPDENSEPDVREIQSAEDDQGAYLEWWGGVEFNGRVADAGGEWSRLYTADEVEAERSKWRAKWRAEVKKAWMEARYLSASSSSWMDEFHRSRACRITLGTEPPSL